MSNFIFTCPHCQNKMDAENDMIGKTATCPFCKQRIVIKKTSSKQLLVVTKAVISTFEHICPNCGETLVCSDNLLGQTLVCPNCDRLIAVPEREIDLCFPAWFMIFGGSLLIIGSLFAMLMRTGYIGMIPALLSIPAFFSAWMFQQLYKSNELQKKQIDLQNKQLNFLQELLKK